MSQETTGQQLWQQKCELIPPSHSLGSLPVTTTPLVTEQGRVWAAEGTVGSERFAWLCQNEPQAQGAGQGAWTRSPGIPGPWGLCRTLTHGPISLATAVAFLMSGTEQVILVPTREHGSDSGIGDSPELEQSPVLFAVLLLLRAAPATARISSLPERSGDSFGRTLPG